MDVSLIILLALVTLLLILAIARGGLSLALEAVKRSLAVLKVMWWRVFLGIILAGFVQTLLPRSLVAHWMGADSGLTGVFLGAFAGMVLTGGAFVVIPVIASIYAAGAGEGAIIALLTAANLTRIQGLLIMEVPFFGARIALTRYVICLFIPPLTGLLGNLLFKFF